MRDRSPGDAAQLVGDAERSAERTPDGVLGCVREGVGAVGARETFRTAVGEQTADHGHAQSATGLEEGAVGASGDTVVPRVSTWRGDYFDG